MESKFKLSERPWLVFSALVILGLVVRIYLTFTMKYYVNGDEAFLGLWAMDILQGKSKSLLDTWLAFQSYNLEFRGGEIVTVYLAVPFLWLFGISSLALRYVNYVMFFGTQLVAWVFLLRYFSFRTALYYCLFYSLAPPVLMLYSIYFIGVHDAGPFLFFLILLIYWEILYREKNLFRHYFIFGIICGIAFWILPFLSTVILACLLVAWMTQRKFYGPGRLDAVVLGGLVGWSPMLVLNFITSFASFLSMMSHPQSADFLTNLKNYILIAYPQSMTWADKFVWKSALFSQPLNVYYSYLGCLVITLAFLYYAVRNRSSIPILFRNLFHIRFNESWKPSKEFFLILYSIVWFIMITRSAWANYGFLYHHYWYFNTLLIALFILLCQMCTEPFSGKNLFNKAVLFTVKTGFFVFLIFSLCFNIAIGWDGWKTRLSSPKFSEVIDFLKSHHLTRIYANNWAARAIQFESKQVIIPTNEGIENFAVDPERAELVNRSKNYAIVLSKEQIFRTRLENYLNRNQITYQKKEFDCVVPQNYAIYYGFSRPIRPMEITAGGDIAKVEITPGLKMRSSLSDYNYGLAEIPFRVNKTVKLDKNEYSPQYWSTFSSGWLEIEFPQEVKVDYAQIKPYLWKKDIGIPMPGKIIGPPYKIVTTLSPLSYRYEINYWDESSKQYQPISVATSRNQTVSIFSFKPVESRKFRFEVSSLDTSNPYVFISDIALLPVSREAKENE